MNWQPIETAPKVHNGAPILIYDPSNAGEPDAIYVVCYRYGEWEEAGGETYSTFHPTHWMPLPEPPQ